MIILPRKIKADKFNNLVAEFGFRILKQTNYYHNNYQSCEMIHFIYLLLINKDIEKIFELNLIEIDSLFISCLILNYLHPCVREEYLEEKDSDISLLYNDYMIIENFQLSETLKLIKRNENCDIFDGLSRDERKYLKKLILKLVRSSHIKKIRKINQKLTSFCTFAEKNSHNSISKIKLENLEFFEKLKVTLMKSIIIISKTSFLFKPNQICQEWINRLYEETKMNEIPNKENDIGNSIKSSIIEL